MTLYVCDLEDDLSLKEIKTLIDERALSGVSLMLFVGFQMNRRENKLHGMMMLILINWIALYPLGKSISIQKPPEED